MASAGRYRDRRAQPISDGHDFESWRRGLDYYDEGRPDLARRRHAHSQADGEKKSLDDFCKLFHGGKGGPPELKTYETGRRRAGAE